MIVVILVHNQQQLTQKCFSSITNSKDDKAGVKVVVVDQASDNGEWLKAECETRGFVYRRNEVNKWFTEANAEVIDAYPGEDIYLLNNDTEVADGWLSGRGLLAQYGALGAVQTVPQDKRFFQFLGGEDNYAGHKVAWEWRADKEFARDANAVIPSLWLTGAAMMISRVAYDKVGGLDLALKHYCSDSDLSLRLVAGKYKIGVKYDMRVMHYGSMTFMDVGQKDPKFQMQGQWDQENFAKKHKVLCGKFDYRVVDCKQVYDRLLSEPVTQLRNIEASKVEADTLLTAFPDLPRWKVLELGCAWGEVVRYLREAGADAYGIDSSEAAGLNGYTYISKQDLFEKWHVETSFDMIYSKAVLEHLPEDKICGLIGRISDTLRPGGITHHNIDTIPGDDPTHITIHPIEWWVEQFEAAGFETVETRHIEGGIYWATWRKR